MFKPFLNTILVEIADEDAKWGTGNDDSMLGRSYREGTVVDIGLFIATADYPTLLDGLTEIIEELRVLIGKQIMWNEGVEAGTVFESDGKQYAFIYWWDIRGVKD